MDTVILAGGKGTRLGLQNIPKPMVDFGGIPLIHRQLLELEKAEIFKNVYVLTGYLGNIIQEYFQNISFNFIQLFFVQEQTPLGTAGAISQVKEKISDRFLVIYGDTYFDINFERFIDFDKYHSAPLGTLFIHPNDHPYDSDLVILDETMVKSVKPKPHKQDSLLRNFANAAFFILSKKIFDLSIDFIQKDLGRDIFPFLPEYSFKAYLSSEYIKDIGTKQRLNSALEILQSGHSRSRNFKNPQKAFFLDRDGIINHEKKPFVDLSNFEIYNDLSSFLKLARDNGYLLFVVTNQPSIAKGFISVDELDLIHQKLEQTLLEEGVFFDEIKYCPHHPEKGFPGEIPELKIECDCRKPENKLILDLIKHYNIDTNQSFFIGDRYRDIEAGARSGLKTILINRGLKGNDMDLFPNTTADYIFNSLNEISNI